ncbi:MAG: hypothetical protein ACYS6W_07715 [Planctomycetota bacterium]|jgi:hypothetical protein
MAMLTLGITVYGRWKLGVGDPTIVGWLITVAFIATAVLCWVYARCPESLEGHRVFWGSLAVALLVLGINKQLDLHVLLEAICREVAKTHGWYSQRRTIQMLFVMGLATVSLAFVTFTGWAMRHIWRRRWLAFCGIILLVAFIIVRAASINHVFEMLKLEPAGIWLCSILELGGITCIGVSAVVGIVNHRKRRKYQILFPPP